MTLSLAWTARWKRRTVWFALLLASRAVAQPVTEDSLQSLRAEFLEAYTAAQLGLNTKDGDSPALESYALYPYVVAARLTYAQQHASAGAKEADSLTENFLGAHGREPVTGPLRRAWLES